VSAKTSPTDSLIALIRDHLEELTLESRDKERTPLAHLAAIASGRVEEGSGATLLAKYRNKPLGNKRKQANKKNATRKLNGKGNY
jgi:hypothetical protein